MIEYNETHGVVNSCCRNLVYAPRNRAEALFDFVDSSIRLADTIDRARRPYRGALITFAAIGLAVAFLNLGVAAREYSH